MIRGIFFDLGGTLRICDPAPEHQAAAARRMAELAGEPDPKAFLERIDRIYEDKYRTWALGENKEAGDYELWADWLLPELPEEKLREICHEMTYQYRQAALDLKRHTNLIAKIINHKTFCGFADETLRDLLKIMYTGKISKQINAREYFGHTTDFMVVDFVLLQEFLIKACGKVRISNTVAGIFGFKEESAGVEFLTSKAIFHQIAETSRVIIMAVAQDYRIQITQIHAQTVGVVLRIHAGTTIKKNAAVIMFNIKRESMLSDQGLMLRSFVVHQCCDA